MQQKPVSRLRKSPTVRRRLGQIERLENRRLMTVVPPMVENDLYSAPADQVLEVSGAGVLTNDSGTGPLTAHLFNGPEHGSLTLNESGSFVYTPDAGYTGLDSFMYWAKDGDAASMLAAVTLRVSTDGGGPQTLADAYSVDEDDILSVPAPAGVLDNDQALSGFPLTAELVTGPENGTLSLAEDGSFTYTPNSNFTGTDTFTYIAHEGNTSSEPTTVTLTVREVNDKPLATNDSYSTTEDGSLVVDTGGVLANDSDLDGQSLVAQMVSDPLHGTVTMNEDGTFTYTPDANFFGIDGFSYLATDGAVQSQVATVTINVSSVNDVPVANNDEYTLDEDTSLTVDPSGLLANDSDVDGDSLTAVIVDGPQNGELTLNSDGSFTYTPSANFSGVDSFSYLVNDGATDSAVATVTLNVTDTNDSPVANNDEYTMDEDGILSTDAGSVLANDTDGDGDTLLASLVSGPQNGTLALNSDGTFSYTPNADFSGVDGFSYLINDGTADSSVATVTINVNSVNDAPVASNDEYTMDEDSSLTIDAATGVLGNDTDAEGDVLTPTVVSGPQSGELTLNADGSFSYAPSADFSGTDTFSYTVNDGAAESSVATVTITVNSVNDAPVVSNDEYSMDEDAVLTVDAAAGILGNDSDAEGDVLTPTVVSGPQSGELTLNADGSFTYTPSADFNGVDGFSYVVNDGTADSTVATVTINVNSINDAPVAGDDAYAVDEDGTLVVDAAGVLGNDSDSESDTLTPTVVDGPQNGTLAMNSDGSFSYTPNANYNGTDTFTYRLSDGVAESNLATVTISVTPVNDAPVATAESYTMDEDSVLTIQAPGVLANDTDIDGDALSAAVVTGPQHGTLTMAEDGSFVYTPAANYNGTDSFTYKTTDGSLESQEVTVSIVVNPIPDAPITGIDSISSGEDGIVSGNVLANDFDGDGLTLTAELASEPTNGTVALNSDGSFTYSSNENYFGTDTFTYIANNGVESSTPVTVTIHIDPINDAPTAVTNEYNVPPGGIVVVDAANGVLADDTDVEDDMLTAKLLLEPKHGTLVMSEDGSFTYTPDEGFVGDDRFYYQANDGKADSNVVEVVLHVAEPTSGGNNSAPVGTADNFTMTSDETLNLDSPGVLANDTDADGDTLTATVVTGPTHGSLTLNADGSLSYTPEAGFVGEDSFTYSAGDAAASSDPVMVTITISEAASENEAPVSADDQYVTGAGQTLEIAASGVLANDADAEGDAMTAAIVAPPTNGTLALADDGSFVYVPNSGFTGTDTFTYVASDGALAGNPATVTITVATSENTRPNAVNDQYTTAGDGSLEVMAEEGVLANDSDAQGDALVAVLFSGPQHGTLTLGEDGAFSYTPEAGYSGLDSFIYRVFDGARYSALAAVTIHVTAQAPVSGDPGFAPVSGGDDTWLADTVDALFGCDDPLA